MSRDAVVVRTERVNGEDGHGLDVVVDPNGEPITTSHYAPPGVDAVPLPGDFASLSEGSGSGAENAVGYADVGNAGTAAAGEIRLYARNAAGTLKVELWLKGNGSLVIDNGSGSVELEAGGDVVINGVRITAAGAIEAPGEVTAMATTPATAVKLSTHLHATAVGPTQPPTPGT